MVQPITVQVQRLRDSRYWVRLVAAHTLGDGKDADENVVSALLACLSDDDVDLCVVSAAALVSLARHNQAIMPALLTYARHSSESIRWAVAQALGALQEADQEVIATLISCLQDEDAYVRERAAYALGQLKAGDPVVVEALFDALRDFDPGGEYGEDVILALAKLGSADREALNVLIAGLHDPDRTVQRATIQALGLTTDYPEEATTALLAILEEQEPLTPSGTVKALAQLTPTGPAVVAALLTYLQRHAPAELSQSRSTSSWVQDEGLPLLAKLGKDDPSVGIALLPLLGRLSTRRIRRAAAQTLIGIGRTGDAERQDLHSYLQDEDQEVRRAAALVLGYVWPLDAVTQVALRQRLDDHDVAVRRIAAWSLGNLRCDLVTATTALLDCLEHGDVQLRWEAIESLGATQLDSPNVRSALLACLSDDRREIYQAAVHALVDIGAGGAEVILPIVESMTETHIKLYATVVDTLVRRESDRQSLGARLAPRLATTSGAVRLAVLKTLACIDEPGREVLQAVLDRLPDATPDEQVEIVRICARIKDAAPTMMHALVNLLQTAEENVRREIAMALGVISGTAESMAALLLCLRDDEWRVLHTAVESVARLEISGRGHTTDWRPYLHHEDAWVRLAAAVALLSSNDDDTRIPAVLLECLHDNEDDDRHLQELVVMALGRLPRQPSWPTLDQAPTINALLSALRSDDLEVRKAALEALGVLGVATPEVVEAIFACFSANHTIWEHRLALMALRQLATTDSTFATRLEQTLVVLRDDTWGRRWYDIYEQMIEEGRTSAAPFAFLTLHMINTGRGQSSQWQYNGSRFNQWQVALLETRPS